MPACPAAVSTIIIWSRVKLEQIHAEFVMGDDRSDEVVAIVARLIRPLRCDDEGRITVIVNTIVFRYVPRKFCIR